MNTFTIPFTVTPTATAAVSHPVVRPRRTRLNANLRRMVRETALAPDDFIAPLFVRHGHGQRLPIGSMPGQYQLSVDQLAAEAREIAALGVPAVLLFGIPAHKDAVGSDNYDHDGIVPQAIRAIKDAVPELVVISDLCFCEYTDHGHCGLINTPGEHHYQPALPEGYLLNDPTCDLWGGQPSSMPKPAPTSSPHRAWWTAWWGRFAAHSTRQGSSTSPS